MIHSLIGILNSQSSITAIDMGSEAIDRNSFRGGGYTWILKDNPANVAGTITSVEIWAYTNMADCKVAIFRSTGTDTFTAVDVETLGSVTAGAKRTFPVSLTVGNGDYIGIYYTNAAIELSETGGTGSWIKSGDQTACVNTAFTNENNTYAYSVHGIGSSQ